MLKVTRYLTLLGAMAAALAAADVQAQTGWPAGTIKLVVAYPPGGSTDVIARLVQPCLQERLAATVIVENRSGGSGSVATAAVVRSAPDGSNWLMVFDNHAANPFVLPDLSYDTEKDLDPVLLIGTGPHVLCTHPSRPYRTFADVVADAKARPDVITCSNGGPGSLAHLTAVMLAKRAGIRLVHVPYRGGGPSLTDALAGHVDLISGTAALVGTQLQAGALRPLVQTGLTRLPSLPDVSTAVELGFVGFEALTWWGCFAPAGTPKEINDRFGRALADVLADAQVKRQLTETLQIKFEVGGPERLRNFLAAQMRTWGPVVRENDVKME